MLFFLISLMIPSHESFIYQTNDKGKLGTLTVTLNKDSVGYRVRYVSDRLIDVIIDTVDFRTLYVYKLVKGKWELSIERRNKFMVNFKGRKTSYEEKGPIFDRHTLDFVLRGFNYTKDFKHRIRLNVPEFMVINADLSVIGAEVIDTPVGELSCWKVMMMPRVIFVKMKFYFWIEKEFPHRFAKYADSSGKNQILLVEYSMDDEEQ
ncbi:MAG TPA: hypothetical protein VF399_12250 [bacterium]